MGFPRLFRVLADVTESFAHESPGVGLRRVTVTLRGGATRTFEDKFPEKP